MSINLNDPYMKHAVAKAKYMARSKYRVELNFNFLFSALDKKPVNAIDLSENDEVLCRVIIDSPFAPISEVNKEQLEAEVLSEFTTKLLNWKNSLNLSNNYSKTQKAEVISIAPLDFESEKLTRPKYLFVKYKSPKMMQKIAFQFHEAAGTMAFFNWNDVKGSILDKDSLLDLDNMTLWIPDILDVSPHDRQTLCTYLEGQYKTDTPPSIIIGSTNSIEELEKSQVLSRDFFKVAQEGYVDSAHIPSNLSLFKDVIDLIIN